MTIDECKTFLAELEKVNPEAHVVCFDPAEAKKRRIESDGVLSFRLPSSQKEAVLNLFERIAAKIGSQSRHDCWDYLLSEFTEL